MFPRARPRTPRTSRTAASHGMGRPPHGIASRLSIWAIIEGTQGQGPRMNRLSTFPDVIAHAEDFAPTPITSDIPCRGHRLSSLPEVATIGTVPPGGASFARRRVPRVVRRRTSAKRSCAHQPEMPSIAGPSSRMVGVSKRGRTMFSKAPDAFFTAVSRNGGRPRRSRRLGLRRGEDGDRPSIE
jgi:hypothetical protein